MCFLEGKDFSIHLNIGSVSGRIANIHTVDQTGSIVEHKLAILRFKIHSERKSRVKLCDFDINCRIESLSDLLDIVMS